MDQYPLAISVPRAELARNWLDRHSTYLIEIDDCGKIYTCHRRYTNFAWLHAELRRRELPGALPELPPKRAVGKLEEAFVERRRQMLEDYLRALLKIPAVIQDDSLWMFLDADLATAAVPRFLCRPQAHSAAGESLRKLESVVSVSSLVFPVCNPAVLRDIVTFVRAEASEAVQAAAQTAPGPHRELQARLANRLRLCSVVKLLTGHERARQGLVDAGAFSSLLALLQRASEDLEAANAASGSPVPDSDARRPAVSSVASCLKGFLERTHGAAMLQFCQQDDGFGALQPLAATEAASLHAVCASLLWCGFQHPGVVLAFASNTACGLPLLGRLLRSPDLVARLLAALCIGCLVRQEGALDAEHLGHCVEALEPVISELDAAEEEALERAAAAASLQVEHDREIAALLQSLCSAKELPRMQILLERPSGTDIAADGVAALALAVLDHFVQQHQHEPESLVALNPMAPMLHRLLDGGWEGEHESEELGIDSRVRVRAARVLLNLDWPATEANTGDPPCFPVFAQRLRMLQLLSRHSEECRHLAASRIAAINEHGRQQAEVVQACGLTEDLCMRQQHLDDYGAYLLHVEQKRGALTRALENLTQARNGVLASLDRHGVKHTILGTEVDEFERSIVVNAELETRSSQARAEARSCEERARAALEQVEVLSSQTREAEAVARERAACAKKDETRASMLQIRASELAEICHNAPAQLEKLQARLVEVGRRKAGLVDLGLQLAVEADRKERSGAALRDSEKEALTALKSLAGVKSELQEFKGTLQSEVILNEQEVEYLRRMEFKLQPARPSRLRRTSDVDGGGLSVVSLGSTGSCETSLQSYVIPGLGEDPGASPLSTLAQEADAASTELAPPAWDDARAELDFRAEPQFRTFWKLCMERERLWIEELRCLQELAQASEDEAAKLSRQKRETEEGQITALEEEEQQLQRDITELSDLDGHALRHQEACAAAGEAHETALAAHSEATEAAGNLKLLETRLERAQEEARQADEALAAAREISGREADLLLRACADLQKQCLVLEGRSRACSGEWRAVEVEERQVGLLRGKVFLSISEESQGREALRAEVRRLAALLGQLDQQLQAAEEVGDASVFLEAANSQR